MSIMMKSALSALALACVLSSGNAVAAEQGHYITSNAVDKCQAFTPGPTNTIRNRVSGAENVGSTTVAVACVFELDQVYGSGSVTVDDIRVHVTNNGAATGAAATVSCTLLPGSYHLGFGTASTQSAAPAPGGSASLFFGSLAYTGFAIGVNCSVPQNLVISHIVLRYRNDAA